MSARVQANIRMLDRDLADAIVLGNRALELATRQGEPETLIAALNCVGCAELLGGDEERGQAHLLQARGLAVEHGNILQELNALGNLGSALGEIHRFHDAERFLREAIACGERNDFSVTYIHAWLALVHCHRGRWAEAADLALSTINLPGSQAISRIMSLIALGRVRARRGDPEAGAALDEALALAGPTATLQRLGPVHAARAEAAWLAGDAERAAEEARSAYDIALSHDHAWFTGELAYWLWKADALDTIPPTMAEPFACQIAGDWSRAAELWDALGCPYEAVRARSESQNVEQLTSALAEFERLGATPAAASVSRRLRELGVRSTQRGPRESTKAHPALLTRREAECLQLLAQGCRNAEIAERLFLSTKTIERRLAGIFAKLDVHSRTEALIEAQRLDLIDQAAT